jgi:hypothetical protein
MSSLFASADAGGAGAIIVVYLIVIVAVIAAWWKVFVKAGEPGWKAIIPIYNTMVMLKIVGRPIWWVVLLFIPCVNIVILILMMIDLAKSFGKSGGFAAGLILLAPIFALILGFGPAQYVGPAGPVKDQSI